MLWFVLPLKHYSSPYGKAISHMGNNATIWLSNPAEVAVLGRYLVTGQTYSKVGNLTKKPNPPTGSLYQRALLHLTLAATTVAVVCRSLADLIDLLRPWIS